MRLDHASSSQNIVFGYDTHWAPEPHRGCSNQSALPTVWDVTAAIEGHYLSNRCVISNIKKKKN